VLRARLATAAVAVPLLLALIFLAPVWLFAVVVGALAVLGVTEYAVFAFPQRRGEALLTISLGALVVLGATTSLDGPGHRFAAGLACAICGGLIWTLLARPDFERGLADLGIVLVGILYSAVLLPHFLWVRTANAAGPRWVLFVLAIGMIGDTVGYFVGRAFGRHKLMPRVSPGKSVEGAIGIMAGSLAAGAAVKAVLLPAASWTHALALAAIMGALGQLGDLSESVIKRTFGVKESGWLFPGHGGVLDRLDSLVFPVTFLYYYLVVAG
jgi:phosphatidate cytidylyltransferase